MRKKYLTFVLILVLFTFAWSGCSPLMSMKKEPLEDGESKTFSVPLDPVLQTVRVALREYKVRVEKEYEPRPHYRAFLGETADQERRGGDVIRVVVHRVSSDRTRVYVISKKKIITEFGSRAPYAKGILSSVTLQLAEQGYK